MGHELSSDLISLRHDLTKCRLIEQSLLDERGVSELVFRLLGDLAGTIKNECTREDCFDLLWQADAVDGRFFTP